MIVLKKRGDLLFESIRGSHLFGLNTEESDVDTFGVFCGPEDWFLGNGKDRVDMVKSEKSDDYWDELGKYFFELGKSNPEALVSLFTPEKFILHFDPVLQPLWDIRDQLLTKECFKSFSGYAYSQIKKAKGLKKAINTDPEEVKERKTPLYFCQVAVGIGVHNLVKWLDDNGLKQEYCGISRLPNTIECYALFYDWGKARENGEIVPEEFKDKHSIGYRGILSQDDPLSSQLRLSSIPKEENPLCWFQFNSNAYTSHCVEYKRYWDWVKNRNQKRFELNTGHNYDCYLESHTRFLTKSGWKFYSHIKSSDKIGCFDQYGNLIFSEIKHQNKYEPDKKEMIFQYQDKENNIAFHVTLNHKLCLRREDWSEYKLITVNDWLKEKDQFKFYQRRSLNFNENPDFSDLTLKVFGYCFSGAVYKNIARDSHYIQVAVMNLQIKKEIEKVFDKSAPFIKGDYIHIPVVDCTNSLFVHRLIFSPSTYNEFVNNLSARQLNIFLEGFSLGYGISDSSMLKLRCTSTGSVTIGHQLSIELHGFKRYIINNSVRHSCLRKNEVLLDKTKYKITEIYRPSVVCFESSTGTLVTSGFFEDEKIQLLSCWGIALHGNSKNMSHCVRIFTMATEIAQGKGMILDRTGIDRDFLMSIKNHELSYDEMFKYVEDLKNKMEETFEKSNLPDSPDLDVLNKIMIKIRKDHYAKRIGNSD